MPNWISESSGRLALALAVLAVGGCDAGRCARNSDCASALVCRAGSCVPPPIGADGGADAGGSRDGGDGPPPELDATVDADAAPLGDAGPNRATTDAGPDGGPAPDGGTDAGPTEEVDGGASQHDGGPGDGGR